MKHQITVLKKNVVAYFLCFSVNEEKQVLKTARNNPSHFICEVIQLRWA